MRVNRAVLDTNVLISAALRSSGEPRRAIDTLRLANGEQLFSNETFDELQTRIWRSKFDRYVSRESRAVYLAQLKTVSTWVAVSGAKMGCRDPDDDKLLETAMMGAADALVTGDGDLLEMTPFHGIPILTPTAFLNRFC